MEPKKSDTGNGKKKAEEAHQEGWITPQRFQKDTKEILKILKKKNHIE
jgi:hypothetical protein